MSSEIPSLGLRWPGQVSSSAGAAQRSVLETIRIGSESWNGGVVARDDEGRMERCAGELERGEDRGGSLCLERGRRPAPAGSPWAALARAGRPPPFCPAAPELLLEAL